MVTRAIFSIKTGMLCFSNTPAGLALRVRHRKTRARCSSGASALLTGTGRSSILFADSEGFVGLASAGHFGLMAGSAHRLSPWPALEQRSQFLRAQKLTSKLCQLASRTSLTPPIPGTKGGSASQRRLSGQSYTGAPCQLRPYCSLRLTPIRGTSADASPRPRSQ